MKSVTLGLALTLISSSNAFAQDCSDPQTQIEMNECAAQFYRFADEDLNLAYGMARDMAKLIDADSSAGQASSVILLERHTPGINS